MAQNKRFLANIVAHTLKTSVPMAILDKPNIDYDFISELEGGQKLNGYVPAPDTSQSGVTIATGFDLGARNEQDLRNLGITGDLLTKLSPYLGKKKQEAVQALADKPLTITKAEADQIDQAVKSQAITTLEAQYNAAIADGKRPFAELPPKAQTVIASVAFQYGDLPSRTPTFWKHVVAQDWKKAIEELRDFGDDYRTRRNKEADLLAQVPHQEVSATPKTGLDPTDLPGNTYAKNNASSDHDFSDLLSNLSQAELNKLLELGEQAPEQLLAFLNDQNLKGEQLTLD